MAFVKYAGLTSPDEMILNMSAYLKSVGWVIIADCVDDLDCILRQQYDGKKLVIQNPSESYFIELRSANGYPIFDRQEGSTSITAWQTQEQAKQEAAQAQGQTYTPQMPPLNPNFYGVGLISSSGYSATNVWYKQDYAPSYKGTDISLGCGLKTPQVVAPGYDLICNYVDEPEMVYFTIDYKDGTYAHMSFGQIAKLASFEGGTLLSASNNSYDMFSQSKGNHPIFSTAVRGNTFLRMDIGNAPSRGIYWASSGSNMAGDEYCYTGKQLAMSIRTPDTKVSTGWIPNVSHYGYIQSQTNIDPGMNVSTLNCITVDLPIYACVIVDPDDLKEFAPVGQVNGCSLVSLFNMASGEMYEISYPTSGVFRQVFPFTYRQGAYGYDGISIVQGNETPTP